MAMKWRCQMVPHDVTVGDHVAITYGLSSELIVRILEDSTKDKLTCEVVRGSKAVREGKTLDVSRDQLLMKVPAAPAWTPASGYGGR